MHVSTVKVVEHAAPTVDAPPGSSPSGGSGPAAPDAGLVVASRRSIQRAHLLPLNLLRAGAIAGQTLVFGLAAAMPAQRWPLFVLVAGCVLYVVASLFALERIRAQTAVAPAAFFRQILIDIAVLTYLLILSGGSANPYHDLYILPVTIAAASLPAAYVWRAAALGITCYTLLEFVHLPVQADRQAAIEALAVNEWTEHVLIALLVAYFVFRVSETLRERDRQLDEAHEREVRAGYAVTLGSVAAGAAHELATPLTTISTVISELRAAPPAHQPEFRRSMELLESSLAECLRSLDILRSSGNAWLQGGEIVTADRFVEDVATRFRAMLPGAQVDMEFESEPPGPPMTPNFALQQAIVNLLSNAAFVSPLDIRLSASWDARELLVRVTDRGPGISPDVAAMLGTVLVTTKPPEAGKGLGLFLTNVTVNRLGGRLRLFNAAEGGAVAEIAVPLASLQDKEHFHDHTA